MICDVDMNVDIIFMSLSALPDMVLACLSLSGRDITPVDSLSVSLSAAMSLSGSMSLSEYGLQDRGKDRDKDKEKKPNHLSGEGHGHDQDIGYCLSGFDCVGVNPELPGFLFDGFGQVGNLPLYNPFGERVISRKFVEF